MRPVMCVRKARGKVPRVRGNVRGNVCGSLCGSMGGKVCVKLCGIVVLKTSTKNKKTNHPKDNVHVGFASQH